MGTGGTWARGKGGDRGNVGKGERWGQGERG